MTAVANPVKLAFEEGLRALGLEPEPRDDPRTTFRYEIPVGRFIGTVVVIGLDVPGDWPNTPPSGPHVSGRMVGANGAAPGGTSSNTSGSNFGADFEYWSRPYPSPWGRDGRTVAAYLAFLRKLFAEA